VRPSFSVIIAAYEAAGTVGGAVASALHQTYPPLEVIVCDDGSTDDLDGALAPHRASITMLRKANGGEASAKNAAARAASGDFVVILDADDVFLPQRLEKLAALAVQRPQLDILTTDAWLEHDGRPFRRCYTPDWPFAYEDQRAEILRRNFVFGLAAVRRRALLDAGGFDESIARTTDWDLWIRLILRGAEAGVVMEPLARYRVRRESLSADRIGMRRGAVTTLRKARADPALRAGDVPILDASVGIYERELRLLEGRSALIEPSPGVRRRMLGLARDGGLPVRARALALLAALAPRSAGRVQRRRAQREWTGAAGTRVAAVRQPGPGPDPVP
jgi:glycosyltransferase involved in cell wall biosynthesis